MACALLAVALLALLAIEALLASRGKREAFEHPSRSPRQLGDGGAELTYLVLGDSTATGEGGVYERGIAVASAAHLARRRQVRLVNAAISGARATDVARDQVALADTVRPDVALVAVGANDVIRLSSRPRVRGAIESVVDRLVAARCDVKVVLTGAPDMGSVPRFAQPLRWVAGLRARQLNGVFESIATERELTFARIAGETGPLFRRDQTLFAADRFHPSDRGYATWVPVLARALDEATSRQPTHCRR